MFFTLKEIVKWLGITSFEIWMQVLSVAVFSVLSVLKYELILDLTWWEAFTPLFICDGLCAYFCIIVFIRIYKDFRNLRPAVVRLLSSLLYVTLLFVFKILLSQKLSRTKIISNSEVMAPLFILLQIVMIRACQVH